MTDRANALVWKLIDQYRAGLLTATDLEDGIYWVLVNDSEDGSNDPEYRSAVIADLVTNRA